MAESFEFVVRGGEVFTPSGLERVDLGLRGGKIVAIGDLTGSDAETVMDASGLTVLPGVIDTQVHFREPGLEHKEDIFHGTKAAAKGGVTAIFEMPKSKTFGSRQPPSSLRHRKMLSGLRSR